MKQDLPIVMRFKSLKINEQVLMAQQVEVQLRALQFTLPRDYSWHQILNSMLDIDSFITEDLLYPLDMENLIILFNELARK